MKKAKKVFRNYKEYESAYLAKWYALHPLLHPDMNWVRKDWDLVKKNLVK